MRQKERKCFPTVSRREGVEKNLYYVRKHSFLGEWRAPGVGGILLDTKKDHSPRIDSAGRAGGRAEKSSSFYDLSKHYISFYDPSRERTNAFDKIKAPVHLRSARKQISGNLTVPNFAAIMYRADHGCCRFLEKK